MINKIFIVVTILLLTSCAFIPKTIIPYSMEKVGESKYIDNTAITAEQYAEFVFDNNEDKKPIFNISKTQDFHYLFYPVGRVDTTFRAFGKIDYYQLPVVQEDIDSLSFKELRQRLDAPIVGIAFSDVIAYCDWRTSRYKKNTTHTKASISFSLPSAQEVASILESAVLAEYSDEKGLAVDTLNREIFYSEPSKDIGFRCIGKISK